jgi:hypothetical protein
MTTLQDECIICQKVLENKDDSLMNLTQKGVDGINKTSKSRESNIVTTVGSIVHINCRKRFTGK